MERIAVEELDDLSEFLLLSPRISAIFSGAEEILRFSSTTSTSPSSSSLSVTPTPAAARTRKGPRLSLLPNSLDSSWKESKMVEYCPEEAGIVSYWNLKPER